MLMRSILDSCLEGSINKIQIYYMYSFRGIFFHLRQWTGTSNLPSLDNQQKIKSCRSEDPAFTLLLLELIKS